MSLLGVVIDEFLDADLDEADLTNANLTNVDLTRAINPPT
jgi:uncharacterized protein YjbI with pentapeptide repeats